MPGLWEQVWRELRDNLERQPHCREHPEYPCVRTLNQGVINDILRLDDKGVQVRSHRTKNPRVISVGSFRAWWEHLEKNGTIEESPTGHGRVIGTILARCLPNRIAHDGGKKFRLLTADESDELTIVALQLEAAGFFDPTGITDARERVLASIVRRQGRLAFRQCLLTAYGGRCAITACNVEAVLDAAHIVPYKGPDTDDPRNGLLLRTDLHTLFDRGLVAIDGETMTVVVSPALIGTSYERYRGKSIRLPDHPASRPSREALDHQRYASGLS